jgi:hypothetical protein
MRIFFFLERLKKILRKVIDKIETNITVLVKNNEATLLWRQMSISFYQDSMVALNSCQSQLDLPT